MTAVVDPPITKPPVTVVTVRTDNPPLPQPRRLSGSTRGDRLNILGAVVSAYATSSLLFGTLSPLSGALGHAVVFYVLLVVVYGSLVSLSDTGPTVRDRVMTVALASAAIITFASLAHIIFFTLWRGRAAFAHTNFYTEDMAKAGPLQPISVGGIKHAVVGTLWTIAIALAITVPLGITAAIYLNEVGGRVSKFVRTIVDAMTALPSVVAGLFIYALWILALGQEKSGLAAAMAISVMMLPIIIRATDVVLRLVPGSLREASAAMGAPQWRTVWHVVLPTARSGIATAVILGTARGIGETAPVLLTAGFTASLNVDPLHGPMVSLPLAAFEFIKQPQPPMIQRGFATAAVLMVLVLGLFILARVVGGHGPGQLTPRRARRLERASAGDIARMHKAVSPPTPAPDGRSS